MRTDGKVTLCYAPNSRAGATLLLLEELGAPYELKVLNLKKGEQRQPAYLAVNPMGKVPAIIQGDALITEQVAIYIYLADLFPQAGLAPPIGDPQRGPYLRWLVFYGSSFEPAMIDRAMKREPGRPQAMPYGDFETMFGTLTKQLEAAPYFLGERFSAADLLWGSALTYMIGWKLLPELPVITAYIARHNARPAVARVKAKNAEIEAAQAE
jgi:glutathione S-transferase